MLPGDAISYDLSKTSLHADIRGQHSHRSPHNRLDANRIQLEITKFNQRSRENQFPGLVCPLCGSPWHSRRIVRYMQVTRSLQLPLHSTTLRCHAATILEITDSMQRLVNENAAELPYSDNDVYGAYLEHVSPVAYCPANAASLQDFPYRTRNIDSLYTTLHDHHMFPVSRMLESS